MLQHCAAAVSPREAGEYDVMIVAASFDDFSRAVRSKLIREISSRETPAAALPG